MALAISSIDLAILITYLLAVVAFGMWVGRKNADAAGFLVAGRDLPWWAVLFSIVATETSTVTFLSVPGMIYSENPGNLTFLQLALGYIIGRYAVTIFLLPLYFKGKLFTAYQVLEQQFGDRVKQIASLMFIVTRSLADGLRLYLSAVVLQKMTGVDMNLAVVVMGVATIVYTFFGGMRAVVWTDVIQFFVYIGGAMIAGALIIRHLPGGLADIKAFAEANSSFRMFDFRFNLRDPYLFWTGILGGAIFSLGTHGADQMMVQRYLCARSEKEASRALGASGWIVLLQFALFLLLGVGLAAFYASFPPENEFAKADEVFAHFIVNYLPIGITGITLAAVFSAAMSTLSSSLNSSAATAVNDIYLPLFSPNATDADILRLTRILTVCFGIIQIAVGIGGQYAPGSVIAMVLAIAGFTTGVVLGLFLLGMVVRHANETIGLVAIVVGLVSMSGIAFGTSLAWPWFALVGSLITVVTGMSAAQFISKSSS